MLRRFWASSRREVALELGLKGYLVRFDECIKTDADAAIREGDDGGVTHSRIFPDFFDEDRRVVDKAPAAAFAVGEIEQAARNGLIDFLAGLQPQACDQRLFGEDLALLRRQRL